MHVDKLEYGWWDRKHGINKLPTTIGHEKNIVLTKEEIDHYLEVLEGMRKLVAREHANAKLLKQVLERRHLPTFQEPPQLLTLCALLERMCESRKLDIEMLKVMKEVAVRAAELDKGNVTSIRKD